MREMPTQMGATGNNRGAEGLPEVQESVLEHTSEESHSSQALDASIQQIDSLKTRPEGRQCASTDEAIEELLEFFRVRPIRPSSPETFFQRCVTAWPHLLDRRSETGSWLQLASERQRRLLSLLDCPPTLEFARPA
jgi:hypothetical protein